MMKRVSKDTGPIVVIVVTKATQASLETGLPMVWNSLILSQCESLDLLVLHPGSKLVPPPPSPLSPSPPPLLFFFFCFVLCVWCMSVYMFCMCVVYMFMNMHVEARGQYWKFSSIVLCYFLFLRMGGAELGDHWFGLTLAGWRCICFPPVLLPASCGSRIWVYILVLIHPVLTEPSLQPQAYFFL